MERRRNAWVRVRFAARTGAVLPFEIPPGTTPRTLLTELLPRDHARLVPAEAGRARVLVQVDDARYELDLDGPRLSLDEAQGGIRAEDRGRFDIVLTVAESTIQRFLDDWSGPKRWLPKFTPQGGVHILTDPRLVRRAAMVTGSIEIAVADFEGGPVGMRVAAGARAMRGEDEADAVVDLSMDAFERLLAGTLGPDDAIADRHVTVRGKKLVAMQFALALVPFFPPH
jgi:hypothetical protein